MVYVDPKDQQIVTQDNVLFKAWEDRKELRHKHFIMAREIAELDNFISTYVARVNPTYRPQFGQIGVAITGTEAVSTAMAGNTFTSEGGQ